MERPTLAELAAIAAEEIRVTVSAMDEEQTANLRALILGANAIATHGVGRQGLVMRALAMRLYHMGMPVGVVGDMTTGPLGPGGLLLCSAGPGHFRTVGALMDVAHATGAQVALLTARPDGPLAARADLVVEVPGQTMGGSRGVTSRQLMGSLYEQALWVFFDCLVARLLLERGLDGAAQLAARHTNLE